MCTSLVVNKKKTLVGWNLDLLDMEHRVRSTPEGVLRSPRRYTNSMPSFASAVPSSAHTCRGVKFTGQGFTSRSSDE